MKNLKFKRALIVAKFYYDYPTGIRVIYGAGYLALGIILYLDGRSHGNSLQMFLTRLFLTIGIVILGFASLVYRKRKKHFRLRTV